MQRTDRDAILPAVERAARRTGLALAFALAIACVSYDELPLCAAFPGDLPTSECQATDEVEAYRWALAQEVLRWTQWEFPRNAPLRVHVGDELRVDRVCVGSASADPGWSTRDRVAASLRGLRRVGPAPVCLVDTTLELSGTLVANSFEPGANIPLAMLPCEADMDRCINQLDEVCGFFYNGQRKTYPTPCDACADPRVAGYLEFECSSHWRQ